MTFMYKNSRNCDVAGGNESAYITLSGADVLGHRTEAGAHGVEWHHSAGHSKGRQVIAFFPKNDKERAAIDRLAALVKKNKAAAKAVRAALKAKNLPTSKAALWRHLENTGKTDLGFGHVDYKMGKYGPFVNSYGEPDGRYYFDSSEIAAIAGKKTLTKKRLDHD